jgi:hypothetical protein
MTRSFVVPDRDEVLADLQPLSDQLSPALEKRSKIADWTPVFMQR